MSNPTVACPACNAASILQADSAGKYAQFKKALCSACGEPLFPGRPFALTAEGFNAHVQVNQPLLIDFWASWCGPCQTLAPIFDELADEFEPIIRFAKVDTGAEKQLAQHFNVQTVPTLSFVQEQREVARQVGLASRGELRRWIYEALSQSEQI